MLLMLAGIIALFWLIGVLAGVATGVTNFILVTAIVLVVAYIMGRRTHTV